MIRHKMAVKASMGVVAGFAMLISGCGKDKAKEPLTRRERAIATVDQAKLKIAAQDYSAAIQLCEKAENIDATYDEAQYCIVAANVGGIVESLSDVISLVAGQLGAPAYQSSAIRIKPILASVLEDIEGQLAYIDAYSYKLAAMENPKFHIEDFPLKLKLEPILDLLNDTGTDIKVKGDLSLNVKGTWDKSEILALGATVNAVQGVLDYFMAHQLVIESTDLDLDSTQGFARFIAENQDLLTADPADKGRIAGDETHKGIKNGALAALSFLLGRATDLERVSPAHEGLVGAIKVSAAEADPDAVIHWVDADGDGIPEKVGVPALAALRESITGIEIKTEYENPLGKKAWTEILRSGNEVLANIETGGKSVKVQKTLQAIVDDLKANLADNRLILKPVPDLLALNPGAFFDKPKYVREWIPYYYQYQTTANTDIHYDLALEFEVFENGVPYLDKFDLHSNEIAVNNDFMHFDFSDNDVVTPSFEVDHYTFVEFDGVDPMDLGLNYDGVIATAKTPELVYVILQDPSFGGVIEANVTTFTGGTTFAKPDNVAFNEGFNKLLKYYCIDATVPLAEILNDKAPGYASNRIADCDQ